MTDPLHPRPQLTRERWHDLGGEWDFRYDDDDVGMRERWPRDQGAWPLRIQVPFPPESPASGIGDPSFHPVVWYRRVVEAPAGEGERMLLHFGAVDYRARVWVNGELVATHEGGHTPFSADVTEAWRAGGPQVVVVRAEDQPQDEAQPRGKQDIAVRPEGIWYERTTGIWQPVWLEPVPQQRIARLRWSTDTAGTVGLTVRFAGVVAGSRLSLRLSVRGEVLAEDTYTVTATAAREGLVRQVSLGQDLPDPHPRRWLWSPDSPTLLDATLTLTDAEGQVLDTVDSYLGLRTVGVSGSRFVLNGRPLHLRLVLAQGYWPESHLAAPSAEALRREVELVKELGFNGVRLHQKVEDPRFLSWCDRLGVVVWSELPATYRWSETALVRSTREWLEVLERDVSAPCVVAWVPVNESWGVPSLQTDPAQRAFVEAMYALAKAYDGSRPVVGNDGWEHVVTDMVTVHDYTQEGQVLRARYGRPEHVEQVLVDVQPALRPVLLEGVQRGRKPLLLTEFGGISYLGGIDAWDGYGTVEDESEFLDRYGDLLAAVLDSPVLAGFCYTQLTDTGQERNGLLTEDRRPKVDPSVIRALTSRPVRTLPPDVADQAPSSTRRPR